MTEFDGLGLRGNAIYHLVKNALLDIQARTGITALTMIEEYRRRCAGNSQSQIGIVKNDIRRLATQFERDFLQITRRGLNDQATDLSRPGKGNLIDPRMCCK